MLSRATHAGLIEPADSTHMANQVMFNSIKCGGRCDLYSVREWVPRVIWIATNICQHSWPRGMWNERVGSSMLWCSFPACLLSPHFNGYITQTFVWWWEEKRHPPAESYSNNSCLFVRVHTHSWWALLCGDEGWSGRNKARLVILVKSQTSPTWKEPHIWC